MNRLFTRSLLTVMFVAMYAGTPAGAPYSIADLGTLGGTGSIATSINNRGQVVGSSALAGNAGSHAFMYSDGMMHDLNTLGGTSSCAYAISDSGLVVGVSDMPGDAYGHAFVYSGGAMRDLGGRGGEGSAAYGINNAGTAVGSYQASGGGGSRAFICDGAAMGDLVPSGEASSAYAVNDRGQVAGYGDRHAFLYSGNALLDLGTLASGLNMSAALAVNERGQVAGWSHYGLYGAEEHAFLYDGGALIDLGTFGGSMSSAFGINNSGQVVGWSTYMGSTGDDVNLSGFLYSDGALRDLNSLIDDPDWQITCARDINDRGQIVGTGVHNGQAAAFLMSPAEYDPLPVPEPLTLFLMGIGLAGTALARRRTVGRQAP